MAVQEVQNDLHAHGHLVVGSGVLQQYRGIVEDALGAHIGFLLKVADLGGGRAGVDDQQFVFHKSNLLLRKFSAAIIMHAGGCVTPGKTEPTGISARCFLSELYGSGSLDGRRFIP